MRIIKFILLLCVKIAIIAAALLVATYILLHLVVIPYILIPRLNTTLSAQTKQTVTIKSLRLSPRGRLTLDDVKMAPPSDAGARVFVNRIVVQPRYRDIIRSWLKRDEEFRAPISVAIDGVSVGVRPVNITGAIAADITVKLEREATAQPDVTGRILLRDFALRDIPFFGDISGLNGTIAVSSQQISSEDIRGVLQGKPVALTFSVKDLKQPTVDARLACDQLTAQCSMQYADDRLDISHVQVAYRETSLRASGLIAQLSGAQLAEMRADVKLNLPDLQSLPSAYASQLQRLQPTGMVSAAAQLSGPLKDPLQLVGSFEIACPALTVNGYTAQQISLHAQVRDGECSAPEFRALFNESPITGQAHVILKDPALPFSASVQAGPLELASLRPVFAALPDIAGNAQARLDITGDARSAERIRAVLDATWGQGRYANMKLPPAVTAHASVRVEHMLNVIIEGITVQDGITELSANGSVANLFSPAADVTAVVTTELSRIAQYPFLQAFKLTTLSGSPRLSLTIRGPIAQLATEPILYSLNADSLVYDAFTLSAVTAHGTAGAEAVSLDDFRADFCRGTVTASGQVSLNDPKAGPVKVAAAVEKIDMAELSRALAQMTAKPEGILSGRFSFDGSGITPETCAGKATGEARWEQGRVQAVSLDDVQLKLESELDRGSLSVSLLGITYGKLSLAGRGTYKYFLTSPEITASVQSSLSLEDLRLLPVALPPQITDLALKGVIAVRAEASGPFRAQTIVTDWPQLQINAALVSDKLSIRGVVVQKLDCDARLNNKLLHVSVQGQTYGGSVSLTSDADFLQKDFDHKHALKIANVDIGALLRESKLVPQPHEGILLLTATLNGVGTALPTLQGNAYFSLMKARLSGLEVLNATGELLQLPWLADFTVTQATGSATIKDALVTTDDLTLIGPQATVEARGTVDFDQRLNLLVRLLLSPEAVERTSRTVLDNFFTPEQDRYLTEIAVQGTLSAPQPDVSKFVQDRIKQRAQSEVKGILQGEGKKLLEGLFKK